MLDAHSNSFWLKFVAKRQRLWMSQVTEPINGKDASATCSELVSSFFCIEDEDRPGGENQPAKVAYLSTVNYTVLFYKRSFSLKAILWTLTRSLELSVKKRMRQIRLNMVRDRLSVWQVGSENLRQ